MHKLGILRTEPFKYPVDQRIMSTWVFMDRYQNRLIHATSDNVLTITMILIGWPPPVPHPIHSDTARFIRFERSLKMHP